MNRLPGQDATSHKVPIIGDTNVGKTSIVSSFTIGSFSGDTAPTVGVSTATISIPFKNQQIDMSVWDTAGQEKFRSLVPLYTRHAALLLLVFDVTDSGSFEGVKTWMDKIRGEMDVKCPIFLVANKCDLPNHVNHDLIESQAKELGTKLFYTSALNGSGIRDLFESAAAQIAGQSTQSFGPSPNLERASEKKCCK